MENFGELVERGKKRADIKTAPLHSLADGAIFASTPFEPDWCNFYIKIAMKNTSVFVQEAPRIDDNILAFNLQNCGITTFVPDASVVPIGALDSRENLDRFRRALINMAKTPKA